jgi:hypothetical protein
MGFGHLSAEVSSDSALTRVAPSGLFVGALSLSEYRCGIVECDRVRREISEVAGHLGFCKFPTWSLSVRYNPFVYETEVDFFFRKVYCTLKHVQNK